MKIWKDSDRKLSMLLKNYSRKNTDISLMINFVKILKKSD
jgi:hypothetical protein